MIPQGQVILTTIFSIGFPVGFLILGLLFLWRGIKGKRIGDTPYCRKCQYNLTGLASDVCPECGSDLSRPKARTIGDPKRRWLSLLVAVMILICGGSIGYHGVDPVNYVPFSVIWFFSKHNAPFALAELNYRFDSQSLSRQQLFEVNEYALDQQSRDNTNQYWLKWLKDSRYRTSLTPVQENRYFRQCQKLSLGIRDKVRAGDPLPFFLRSEDRHVEHPTCWDNCNGDWRGKAVISVDGKPVLTISQNEFLWFGGPVFWDQATLDTADLSAGAHTLEVAAKLEFGHAPDTIDVRTEIVHSTQFTLLSSSAPDTVTWLEDPEISDIIQRYMKPVQLFHTRNCFPPDTVYEISFEFMDPLPCSLFAKSFFLEILILEKDRVIARSFFCFRKEEARSDSTLTVRIDTEELPDTVDIVFRGNPDAARETMDMYQTWKGEIRFNDIPVERAFPRGSPDESID